MAKLVDALDLGSSGETRAGSSPVEGTKIYKIMKEVIEIRNIKEPIVELYNPKGIFIGMITSELQFIDVRLQIAEKQLKGYYIVYNKQKIKISSDGQPEVWPKGLYDQTVEMISELLGI